LSLKGERGGTLRKNGVGWEIKGGQGLSRIRERMKLRSSRSVWNRQGKNLGMECIVEDGHTRNLAQNNERINKKLRERTSGRERLKNVLGYVKDWWREHPGWFRRGP